MATTTIYESSSECDLIEIGEFSILSALFYERTPKTLFTHPHLAYEQQLLGYEPFLREVERTFGES